MPLYEVVLRFPDREEVRVTDRDDYELGKRVSIDYRPFQVTAIERREELGAEARIVVEPLGAGR